MSDTINDKIFNIAKQNAKDYDVFFNKIKG